MEEKKSRGHITVGFGTSKQREVEIENFIQAHYKGGRLVTVSQLEDDSYILSVENPQSSGRNPQCNMLLTQDSLMALYGTLNLYFMSKRVSTEELLKNSSYDFINYEISDNLKFIDEE